MSENKHATVAQYGELTAEERQIEATLALAYEQRTANLIAVLNTMNPDGSRVLEKKPAMDLMEHILERLRLQE